MIMEKKNFKYAVVAILAAFFVMPFSLIAQTQRITLEEAVQQSLQNNQAVRSSKYDVEAQRSLKRTSGAVDKLSITGMFGQYNSYVKADNNITISQSIPFPSVFAARAALGNANIKSSEFALAATENELSFQVKATWYELAYLHEFNEW